MFSCQGGWAPKKPVAAVPADEVEEEEFNCSRMGPIKALIQLYPDAGKLVTGCSYSTGLS